jgi:hypothetical protein
MTLSRSRLFFNSFPTNWLRFERGKRGNRKSITLKNKRVSTRNLFTKFQEIELGELGVDGRRNENV